MIKVGVIGAGHLGKIHLNILNNSDFELVGFHDTDVFNSEKLSQEKGYSFFKELHLLIEKIDAAVIVSPTTTHFEIAKECINKGKHIFVEKPLTKDSNEARIIKTMAKEKGIMRHLFHVGSLLRIQNLLNLIDYLTLILGELMFLLLWI